MEIYWKQRKVYLYGLLSLFPDRLKYSELIELEKFAGQKLTDTSKQQLLQELMDYLTKYERYKLRTDKGVKPEQFVSQQRKLILAVRELFPEYGYHPIVTLVDLWPNSKDRTSLKTIFWELILTEHFRTGHTEIINMNYEGTYKDASGEEVPLPFAEFEVKLGTLFQRAIEPPKLKKVPPAAPLVSNANTSPSAKHEYITIRSYDADSGTLFFGNRKIRIIRQKNKQGNAVGETTQGAAMRKLFKDVNTLRNGVPLRTIISVSAANFDSKKGKRAKNHLDEINRKIKEETGVPKLINYDQVNYYLDKSYLH